MVTVYVESNFPNSSPTTIPIEVNPRENVSELLSHFTHALQHDGSFGLSLYDDNHHRLDWNSSLESQGIKEGSRLYLSYDRTNVFHPLHGVVIGSCTLIISIILSIVVGILFFTTGGVIPYNYGIVIDAGSTHTQAFLYQWSANKKNGTGEVYQKATCEYEDGLASGYDPVNIVSCVNNITSLIPKEISSTRLYLGATGGMRLENLIDPKKANFILLAFKYALATTNLQVETVDILKGKDEASFSWISTNFLLETLNKEQIQDTYGALDLGGASTQYAFAVNNNITGMNSTTLFKLYDHEYFVSSQSSLCFGYYEAMDRNEAILMMKGNTGTIADPCLPVGLNRTFEANVFSQKPCVVNPNLELWLQKYPYTYVHGSSNYSMCKQTVEQLLNGTTCANLGFKECLEVVKLGPTNIKFMAFSGFYYIVNFLNGTKSLDEFIQSTKAWCGLTWDEIKQTQPESELQHLNRYCFGAVFITELLTSVYMFDSSTWKNIYFIKEIGGTDVGWSLGFMINATNEIPEEHTSLPVISLQIAVSLIICSIFMFLVSILMVVKFSRNCHFPSQDSLLSRNC